MSVAHLLMLGLIDGASVGIVAQPPATIGELDGFSIEAFYVVDYSGSQRRLRPAEYQFMRGVMRIRRGEILRARRDRAYYDRLERQMQKSLAAKGGKRAARTS